MKRVLVLSILTAGFVAPGFGETVAPADVPPAGATAKATRVPVEPRRLPDLVVTEFVTTGKPVVVGVAVEVPVKVRVKNTGSVTAGPFTVCTAPFAWERVPPSPGPVSVSSLPPGVTIEIVGKVTIPLSRTGHGAGVRLVAVADCCRAGQTPPCSVAESREDNNASVPLVVRIP